MAEENQMPEPMTHKACRMFMCTDRMHRKLFERMVTSLGIHRSQHFLLMNIDRHGAGSQKELAERMKISTAAVAVSLKKLESEGYIERRTAEDDGRNNEISITEAGRRVIGVSKDYIHKLDDAMFDGIDEETLTLFMSCLERIQKNLAEFGEREGGEQPQ